MPADNKAAHSHTERTEAAVVLLPSCMLQIFPYFNKQCGGRNITFYGYLFFKTRFNCVYVFFFCGAKN